MIAQKILVELTKYIEIKLFGEVSFQYIMSWQKKFGKALRYN